MPLLPNVLRRVPPPSTSTVRSPLMVILIFPLGESLAFAKRSNPTNNKMMVKKKAIVKRIVVVISNQISMPIKLMNAMPIKPVMMNVMPNPFKGAGTCE